MYFLPFASWVVPRDLRNPSTSSSKEGKQQDDSADRLDQPRACVLLNFLCACTAEETSSSCNEILSCCASKNLKRVRRPVHEDFQEPKPEIHLLPGLLSADKIPQERLGQLCQREAPCSHIDPTFFNVQAERPGVLGC